jgi:phosphoribosylanthranilate isomerase
MPAGGIMLKPNSERTVTPHTAKKVAALATQAVNAGAQSAPGIMGTAMREAILKAQAEASSLERTW